MNKTTEAPKKLIGRPPGPPKDYLHLWIGKSRKAWLKEEAKRLDIPVSELVTNILDQSAPM